MEHPRQLLTEGVVDFVVLYSFLKKLTTPFKEWEANKLGIIDDAGNILKKRATLTTPAEKRSFTLFDVLVLNIKKMVEKLPGGKSRLASFVAGLFLIKEEKNRDLENEDLAYEAFMDFYETIATDPTLKTWVENLMSKYGKELEEDVPANSVGAGGVAGLTEPIVKKRKKFKEYTH